jgi:hypothetical protein
MRVRDVLMPAVLAVAGSTSAYASLPYPALPYADVGVVRDWYAKSPYDLYIEAANCDWYRASFAAPCEPLMNADMVAVVTGLEGHVDRHSAVVVDGVRCEFTSFDHAADPWRERAGP